MGAGESGSRGTVVDMGGVMGISCRVMGKGERVGIGSVGTWRNRIDEWVKDMGE